MGTGWALQIRAPENQLILAAAIVTTIPIIFVTLYTCFACVFLKLYSSDIRLKDRHIIHSWNCIKSFTLIIQMVAAITEVGGAVLFLVAGYTEQSGSIHSIEHVAGMIGIMTSCCCIFLLPFSPDNCVNLNWRQLQCTCNERTVLFQCELYTLNCFEWSDNHCLWSVCWCVWYDWWMLLYNVVVSLTCAEIQILLCNIWLLLFLHILYSWKLSRE